MDKKASLSETKRAQIVICTKKDFLKKRFTKKCSVTKRLFIKQLLHFKILNFTMTKKGVESQKKKTSPRNDNLIRRIAVWSSKSFCKKIRAAQFLKDTNVHRTTVIRHLVHKFDQ